MEREAVGTLSTSSTNRRPGSAAALQQARQGGSARPVGGRFPFNPSPRSASLLVAEGLPRRPVLDPSQPGEIGQERFPSVILNIDAAPVPPLTWFWQP